MRAGRHRLRTCALFLPVLIAIWSAPLLAQEGRPKDVEATPERGASDGVRLPTATEREAQQRLRFLTPEVLEGPIDDETYILGPHDVLAIMILVGETWLERLPVLPEGIVLIPNVGALPAAGLTLSEFRQALHKSLSQRYQNFELYCHLAEARQFRVYVTGEVRTPGTLVARPYERLSDLIERAAGFTAMASRREIEVRNLQGELLSRVDLAAFYSLGDLAANPHLDAGQSIFVPALKRKIEVRGEVALPGAYEVRADDTLEVILSLAGGTTPFADLSQISVDTIDAAGEIQVRRYDLRQDSPPLEHAVRVAVLSKLLGKRRVFAIMPDNQHHTFYLSKDETLADLVRRSGELNPEADLAQAQLASYDGRGERIDIPVDVARVLSGAEDRTLEDGDVLSISNVPDYVYVNGYVTRPGRYLYRADWTVNDYVGEAGGPLAGANMNSARVRSSVGHKFKTNRSASVRPGDSIYIDRSTGGKLASVLAIFANVSTLVISIVALSR